MLHKSDVDAELNKHLLQRHKPAILAASKLAVLPAMCVLKLINEFEAPLIEALRTDEGALAPATESPLWKGMAQQIEASRKANKAMDSDKK